MMPMIHRPALSANDYVVPSPRTTDAIGVALRDAYPDARPLPESMNAALRMLDRTGRA